MDHIVKLLTTTSCQVKAQFHSALATRTVHHTTSSRCNTTNRQGTKYQPNFNKMNVGAALVAFFLNGICHFSLNLEAARIPINSLSSVDPIRDSKYQHAAKLIDQQEPGKLTTGNQEQFFDLVVKILSANNQQLFKRDDDTVSTTIQPATVDIKTLPGYWLKDPSVLEPAASHEVDYRTERYRLDDLLKTSDTPAAE